ncbi:MAG: nuclear transport factor 2 family protein [Steroidobacteraceae bacterium]
MSNHLHLPEPVATYFAADEFDRDTVARCFTQNAVVKDEGRTYTGLDAIKRWKSDVSVKYTYTNQPFALEQKDGVVIVTSRLTGNFPGSPIDLRFFFRLQRGKIASLEIIP